MLEAINKLKKEFGNKIWISKVSNNQFVTHIVYYCSYCIGESDTNYETMRNNINYYI